MSFNLTMSTNLDFRVNPGGNGFSLKAGYGGHQAQLQIGNVSLAFDDRNDFTGEEDANYSSCYVQLNEMTDDPVRVNNVSVTGYANPAERLLHALAVDLGYFVEKINSND